MLTKIKQLRIFAVLNALIAPILYSTTVFALSSSASKKCQEGDSKACLESTETTSGIMNILILGINFMAAAVGLIAVAMIIVAGIQYTTSNGSPQAVQAAKTKITNVLIGLVSFFLLYSFMQWLIPGGFL